MENENMEGRIIQTEDESGEVHNFELVDIVEVDNQEYAILLYVDEEVEESDDEEQELAVMKLSKEDDAYVFETIDNEDEFNKVAAFVEAELNADLDEEE